MKKLISMLLCAALLSCALPALAAEEELPALSIHWVEPTQPSMTLSPRADGYVNVSVDVGKQDYRYGLMDAEGNLLAEPGSAFAVNPDGTRYTAPSVEEERITRFWEGDKVGYKNDATGEILVEAIYDDGNVTMSEGKTAVVLDGQKVVIDKSGQVLFTHDYVNVWDFSEGLAMVENSQGLIGYVDASGREVVPCTLDGVGYEFTGGLTVLYEDGTGRQGILKNPLNAGKVSDWAAAEVEEARAAGLVTADTGAYMTYDITRFRFARLAVNMVEKATGTTLEAATADRFADTDDLWARKAAQAGIVNGVGDGSSFAPDQLITREQLAAMLYRALDYIYEAEHGAPMVPEQADLSAFADGGAVAESLAQAMSALVKMEVLQGSGGSLMPQENTTVEQAVLMVLRAYPAGSN